MKRPPPLNLVILPAVRVKPWLPVAFVFAKVGQQSKELLRGLWTREDGAYFLASGDKNPSKSPDARMIFHLTREGAVFKALVSDCTGKERLIVHEDPYVVATQALAVHLTGAQGKWKKRQKMQLPNGGDVCK